MSALRPWFTRIARCQVCSHLTTHRVRFVRENVGRPVDTWCVEVLMDRLRKAEKRRMHG